MEKSCHTGHGVVVCMGRTQQEPGGVGGSAL